MSQNVYDVLQERGFIAQTTHEELRELLGKEKVTFYIGFDATADSLTAGHFLTIMAMMHMQKAGHRPIALLGGGTTMIGDPSGKSDMRNMLTKETIDHNAKRFKEQLSRFITFDDDKAILANNADWLLNLNYVEFLREVGVHFSVNKMLTAECYKQRMERGLTFFEFNYMLMQGYDFLELNRRYGCKLEMGGNDQWSNILAGADLIRRKEKKDAYGLTLTLLTRSDGVKMGKTMAGAVWLDPNKTTPYEFFQYWRNVDDADVIKCLKMLTFLPLEQIQEMEHWEGSELNKAKEILAYELTALVHGEEEAKKALDAAKNIFGGGNTENMPVAEITADIFNDGQTDLMSIIVQAGLAASKSEARRAMEQGGVSVNGEKITDVKKMFTPDDFAEEFVLKKGKKNPPPMNWAKAMLQIAKQKATAMTMIL